MLASTGLVVLGIALLALGAELLVRGASRLALSLGVAPMIVGLTVVAFGTSTPEMAASVVAQVHGEAGIALANVVGSNIANIGLILASCGLVLPLPVQSVTVRRDLPVLVMATLAFAGILVLDGAIGRIEGAGLLAGLVAFTIYQVQAAFAERQVVRAEYAEAVGQKAAASWSRAQCAVAIGGGLVLLVAGGNFLVDGAVAIARRLEVSERVIGLTVVAVGTSLPELATSLVAALRREVDVAVGNVIGSNLFNMLGIGGAVALAAPAAAPEAMISFDLPVLAAATLLAAAFLWTGRTFDRLEAGALLIAYVGYVAILF